MDVDLGGLKTDKELEDYQKLFSESTGRLVVTVPRIAQQAFEEIMGDSYSLIGRVTRDDFVVRDGSNLLIHETSDQLHDDYNSTYAHLLNAGQAEAS